jgi:hypothetical protein
MARSVANYQEIKKANEFTNYSKNRTFEGEGRKLE